jgi:hypothetical protein
LKVTASPEIAVALTVKAAEPKERFESVPKVIVWLSCVTEKLWLTGVAAAQLELPGCVALIVQVPAATIVTVDPDKVQTAVVVEAKVTASPEVAVALTVKGAEPKG